MDINDIILIREIIECMDLEAFELQESCIKVNSKLNSLFTYKKKIIEILSTYGIKEEGNEVKEKDEFSKYIKFRYGIELVSTDEDHIHIY